MIAVIDPALFLTDGVQGLLSEGEEKELTEIVDDAARICRAQQAVIPAADWYWKKLQNDLVRPLLRRRRGPRLPQGLDALAHHAKHLTLVGVPTSGAARMWGVKPLFDWVRLEPSWIDVMERLLIGCAQQDDETVLITRLFAGRNMTPHAVGRCTLTEKTRWRVYLHVPGRPPRRIPCIRNPRNLTVPWTARFDEKLPDQGRFPFCPPGKWWLRDTQGCGTHTSKPAWLDAHGSGWVQPMTGGDHHWDVLLADPNLEETVGLSALNVVAWGTRESEKTPGELHHVPKEKRQRLKPGAGWTCPKQA